MKFSDSKIRSLIKEYRNGNQKSFGSLLKSFTPMMYKVIGKYHDPNSLYSEAQLSLLKCVNHFDLDKQSQFQTYFYSCLTKDLLNYVKRHSSLFGKRSDRGGIESTVDLDFMISLPDDVQCSFETELYDLCLLDILKINLSDEELEVIGRFFGVGQFEDVLKDQSCGIPEGEGRPGKKGWILDNISDRTKFNRIAIKLNKDYSTIKDLYFCGMEKLKESTDLLTISEFYLQKDDNGRIFKEADSGF